MLSQDDRAAIEALFERLDEVERNGPDRDPEAEALIARRMRERPSAAYYLAQTVVVQEGALRAAADRITALEEQLGREARSDRRAPAVAAEPRRGPWDRPAGGFLAGAAQTALGVTGGVLLGSALASLLTGSAQAQEDEAPPEDADQDDTDSDDGGFDGGGDFDLGGDF